MVANKKKFAEDRLLKQEGAGGGQKLKTRAET